MASRLREHDVSIYNYAQVSYIMGGKKSAQVQLRKTFDKFSIASFHTDVVLFAPTRTPSDLALLGGESGLEEDTVNGGIVVNAELMAIKDVFCAGSSLSYPCQWLSRRRAEGDDHSRRTGRIAGANACGAQERYRDLPVFQSDALGAATEIYGESS